MREQQTLAYHKQMLHSWWRSICVNVFLGFCAFFSNRKEQLNLFWNKKLRFCVNCSRSSWREFINSKSYEGEFKRFLKKSYCSRERDKYLCFHFVVDNEAEYICTTIKLYFLPYFRRIISVLQCTKSFKPLTSSNYFTCCFVAY